MPQEVLHCSLNTTKFDYFREGKPANLHSLFSLNSYRVVLADSIPRLHTLNRFVTHGISPHALGVEKTHAAVSWRDDNDPLPTRGSFSLTLMGFSSAGIMRPRRVSTLLRIQHF